MKASLTIIAAFMVLISCKTLDGGSELDSTAEAKRSVKGEGAQILWEKIQEIYVNRGVEDWTSSSPLVANLPAPVARKHLRSGLISLYSIAEMNCERLDSGAHNCRFALNSKVGNRQMIGAFSQIASTHLVIILADLKVIPEGYQRGFIISNGNIVGKKKPDISNDASSDSLEEKPQFTATRFTYGIKLY